MFVYCLLSVGFDDYFWLPIRWDVSDKHIIDIKLEKRKKEPKNSDGGTRFSSIFIHRTSSVNIKMTEDMQFHQIHFSVYEWKFKNSWRSAEWCIFTVCFNEMKRRKPFHTWRDMKKAEFLWQMCLKCCIFTVSRDHKLILKYT